MLPDFKYQDCNIGAKAIPHILFTAKSLATGLVETIGKFKDLMKEKGYKG